MNEPTLPLDGLSPVRGKAVVARFDGGLLLSDSGVIALAQVDRRLRVAERLAACIDDPRSPDQVVHSLADMIGFRMKMIAAGYEDGNDANRLRADPVVKMAQDALPSGRDLASLRKHVETLEVSTTARFEASVRAAKVRRFKDFFDGAASWSRVERIIARVEVGPQGADTRFIVTSLAGGRAKDSTRMSTAVAGRPRTTCMDASRPASVFFTIRHDGVSCGNVFGLCCGHIAAGLDEIRGRLPIIKSSSKLSGSLGLRRPRSDRSCHRVEDHPRSSWELWDAQVGRRATRRLRSSPSPTSIKPARGRSRRG